VTISSYKDKNLAKRQVRLFDRIKYDHFDKKVKQYLLDYFFPLDDFLGDSVLTGNASSTGSPSLIPANFHCNLSPCVNPACSTTHIGSVVRKLRLPDEANANTVSVTSILSPDRNIDRKVYKVTYCYTNRFIYSQNYIGIGVGKRRVIRMVLENPRAQRGLQILAADGAVKRISEREYKVKSQSKDGYYDVIHNGAKWECSCPDYQENAQFCKHCWSVELSLKIRLSVEEHAHHDVKVISVKESHNCPFCESDNVIRNGYRKCMKGLNQLYECKNCGKKFSVDNGFSRIHVDAKIVVTAFDLWANGLSPRKIANHIRGVYKIKIGKSTVDRWIRRLGKLLSEYGDMCKPKVGEIWHGDETTLFIKKKGEKRYFEWIWNVMDNETRFWLASTLSKKKEVDDARRALKKSKDVANKKPQALITDGQQSYKDATVKEFYDNKNPTSHLVIVPIRKIETGTGHMVHPGNNIMERLQGTQRERTKVMRSFDASESAQTSVDGIRAYYNLIRPHMGLNGMTPSDAAGVPIPEYEGEGRLYSALFYAYQLRKKRKILPT
jgi:transposase-like protein/predicted RNA-binding Zn-ribbon protein involved in translation (DUF1610 family)